MSTVQLSIPYTDPECHSTQWYRQTDRQTVSQRYCDERQSYECRSTIG